MCFQMRRVRARDFTVLEFFKDFSNFNSNCQPYLGNIELVLPGKSKYKRNVQ